MVELSVQKSSYQIDKVPYEIWTSIFKHVNSRDLWIQQTSSKCWHRYSRVELKKRIAMNSKESPTLCRIYGKFLVSLNNEQWITCMYFNSNDLKEVPDYDSAYFNFIEPSENAIGLWIPRSLGYIPWSDRYKNDKEWLLYDVSRTPKIYIEFPNYSSLDGCTEKYYDGRMEDLPFVILKDREGIFKESFSGINATVEYQIEPLDVDCGVNMDGLKIKLVKFKLLGLSFHASNIFH
ncbi:hypothetical protein H8356DRAFT_944899 [Neocallimastix lanati (nom. inval.)]|nr:hypothetical protein H8356DRAFT_944899 [Neocallimastix sp. JGI-2020a]